MICFLAFANCVLTYVDGAFRSSSSHIHAATLSIKILKQTNSVETRNPRGRRDPGPNNVCDVIILIRECLRARVIAESHVGSARNPPGRGELYLALPTFLQIAL